jgi:hypothetical protein
MSHPFTLIEKNAQCLFKTQAGSGYIHYEGNAKCENTKCCKLQLSESNIYIYIYIFIYLFRWNILVKGISVSSLILKENLKLKKDFFVLISFIQMTLHKFATFSTLLGHDIIHTVKCTGQDE